MQRTRFKRQILALFFIVSLIPALTVAAIWYLDAQVGGSGRYELDIKTFVLPIFILGIGPALLLSLAFAELLARPVRRIHAAALELARGNYKTHFQTGGAGEFKEIGAALDRVAGQLERTISETASETALIEAERNKLRGVLNSMTDGVFALDRGGRIILFNKAASEITGRSIEEVAGQLAEKVMPFRDGGELVMARWLATQGGVDHQIGQWRGLELYRADGASLYVDVQAVVLSQDPNGINALVTFHDLTKSHQLEEMKIDFVALAAHELRTPLTEIKGYLDILQHEAKGLKAADKRLLDRTMESATQLSGLVNNLLNVARIEHGEINYQPLTVDFLAFIEEFSRSVEWRFKDEGRTLKLSLPARLPLIVGDPNGLREVMTNLIDNALAHTQPKLGIVTIAVRAHRTEIEVSLSDNGSGMPASALPRLFTKFYRIDEYKATTRGTGLGLYISKSIIEAHGGEIWAESVEGMGSTFSFRLPIPKIAPKLKPSNNKAKDTRGAHGWIKDNTVR